MRFSALFVWLMSLAALTSCAEVQVVRINDDNRDCAKGFRYYLPRPYVAVKKPFPVAGNDYFLWARLSDDGTIAEIQGTVPAVLEDRFPGGKVPAATVVDGLAPSPEARNDSTGSQQAASATKSPEFVSNSKWLEKSTISPEILVEDQQTFEIQVKLDKGSPFSDLEKPTVGLIPQQSDGKPSTDGFFTLLTTEVEAYDKGQKDGTYKVAGRRADLKGAEKYYLALAFKGKRDGAAATDYVLHQPEAKFRVLSGKAPDPKPAKNPSTESKKSEKTSANLTVSGDPRTDPLQKVNDYFDVLYLQDFDEQYAISTSAGLGKASARIGLENGWMLEHAAIEIDNTELGEFVFSNIEKFVDIASTALEATLTGGASAAPAMMEAMRQQKARGEDAGPVYVLLRVRYLTEALPGLYPILKSSERAEHVISTRDTTLLPIRPYTVIAYNTRTEVVIELVSVRPSTSAGSATPSSGPQTKRLSSEARERLKTWIGKLRYGDDKQIADDDVFDQLEFFRLATGSNIVLEVAGKSELLHPILDALNVALQEAMSDGTNRKPLRIDDRPVIAFRSKSSL